MEDQRKGHIDTKGPKQRNRSKQLQTYNLLTNDMENINSTNKGRDLLLANKPRFVPWRTERMCKGSRVTAELLNIDQHIFNEQDQTEESSYGLDWRQKGIWYSFA